MASFNSASIKQIYPFGSDGKAIDVKLKHPMDVDEYLKAIINIE